MATRVTLSLRLQYRGERTCCDCWVEVTSAHVGREVHQHLSHASHENASLPHQISLI